MSEPVKGFEHRANPSYWRVEWFDAGSCEAAVFSGTDSAAAGNRIRYAERGSRNADFVACGDHPLVADLLCRCGRGGCAVRYCCQRHEALMKPGGQDDQLAMK